jgi:N-acetylglucosamine kinase-like BadF-type ATPase
VAELNAPRPRNPAAVLAIDGGNSKTDVALVADDGSVLGYARGPGSCHQTIGLAATVEVLTRLVEQAAAEAGLGGAGPVARWGAFYLAGADLPLEVRMLCERLDAAGWVEELTVDNDTFALLRAGSERPDRVAVVCGAGVNCVGLSASGGVVRFPSLGRLTGDWGGGYHLGSEALWLAIRAEDGRGAPTALEEAVATHFGAGSVTEVAAAVHLGQLSAARLHELVPVLFRVAEEGDDAARAVVLRMAEEVVLMATAALRRLGLLGTPADVVLGGGVLSARDPLLLGTVLEQLARVAPHARPVVVDEPPVVGAALLGLDALRAPHQVEDDLRSALLRAMADRVAGLATAETVRGGP